MIGIKSNNKIIRELARKKGFILKTGRYYWIEDKKGKPIPLRFRTSVILNREREGKRKGFYSVALTDGESGKTHYYGYKSAGIVPTFTKAKAISIAKKFLKKKGVCQ